MGNEQACTDLALNSLKLTEVSVNVLKDTVQGGKLKIQVSSEIQTANKKTVDKDRPGRLELKVALTGMEREKAETGSAPEKAFEIMGTMVGTFQPRERKSFSVEEFSNCHDWIVPQVYLPLRAYLLHTLEQVGVKITLPLTVPPKNPSETD